jgi:hypothetical protein
MITEGKSNKVIPFWAVVPTASLGASTSNTFVLQLGQDSYFEWHGLWASTDQDADTDFMPNNFSVLIKDLSTGIQLMDQRIPQRILCGPANGGFKRLVRPVQFNPGANISFDVLSLYSGGALVVTLVLDGYKIML